MIVRRLRLHPFAGTADREFVLEPGLNVILGPNEAGKTTFGNALRQALFVSTKLTLLDSRREVDPYLPLGGGDTIRVSVDVDSGGQTWKLTKSWGGGSASELRLPDGGLISDSETVDTQLAELLGLSRGTWEHALFAHQGGMGSAPERIGDSTALKDLNEVLRRAVFETDGVSIEALEKGIAVRRDNAFGRWDRDLVRPEGNRGLENRWVKGPGRIVNAWYNRAQARAALEETATYYRQLDDITARLNAAVSDAETLKTWVEGHAAVATDAEKRAGREGRLAQVKGKEEVLRKISQEWPVAEAKAGELESKVSELNERAEALSTELQQAKAWEDTGLKRATLESADDLQEKVEKARQALDNAPTVEAEEIEPLDSLEQERVQLQARLEAADLGVTFRAHKAIVVESQAGVERGKARSLAEGESLEFAAGGRVVIHHTDWELEVRSGDIDVAGEKARHDEIVEEAGTLLRTIGATDLAEARTLQSDFRGKADQLAALQQQLADLLGEESLDSLRAEVEPASGVVEPKRKVAEVAEESGKTVTASGHHAERAAERRGQVEEWEKAYESTEALLDQLVEQRAERTQLEKEILALRPLPEGVDDAQTFVADYREKKEELDRLKAAQNDLLIEKARIEGRAPSLEPAEATEGLAEAEAIFERACREGEALDRIHRDFETLQADMDEGTLQPWLEHLAEVVSPLTQERYRTIDLAGGAFARAGDEVKIPFKILSMGTRACLGLAVRLSMARWFLEDRRGFLVLDDPFVDLDPERQQAAAAILHSFAREKQVILFACHPRHAEILGGETVEL